jgi:hypothetical protein
MYPVSRREPTRRHNKSEHPRARNARRGGEEAFPLGQMKDRAVSVNFLSFAIAPVCEQ